jgi:protocatechuate 4,5-dioxygenase beta chain
MAVLAGAVATSHIPAIGKAMANGLQHEPYWKAFFEGYIPVREWLADVQPDVAVVIYNDHGLNFFLDKMPTFAVGAAGTYRNADEGWGLPVTQPFPGHPELSWHIIESLVAGEFDITMCQEMLVDHGFVVPMTLLWPGKGSRPVRTVPIAVNTVQYPYPSPARCLKLGRALGRAIESFQDENLRVVILGTGGLSHQLDGERAGFINTEFDRMFMRQIVDDPEALGRYTTADLVRLCGAQGVEILNWLVMRGAFTGAIRQAHRSYHVPVSNTAAGVLVIENVAEPVHAPEKETPLCL